MADTIPALFRRQAAAFGPRTLFLAKRQGAYREISWQQAQEGVDALTTYLLSQQVNQGDRVLLLSENRPEWGIADLAVQSAGAWTVPLYPTLTEPEIRLICRDCEPVVCIASSSAHATTLAAVSRQVGSIRVILVMDPDQLHPAMIVRWEAALQLGRERGPKLQDLAEHRRRQIRPEHTATLIYTSGTTGEPKGVMLSHRNFLSNVQASLDAIPIFPTDRHLSFLPLCHVFERMAGWYLMLRVGASVAYAESMDTIPANMLEVRPTVMLGVPRFFEKLHARIQEGVRQASPLKRALFRWAVGVGRRAAAQRFLGRRLSLSVRLQHQAASTLVFRKLRARLGGRLRFFISGSAPLPRDIGEFFYSAGVTILEGYGLTETSPVIAVNRLPVPRFGTVGRPLAGVEVRLADDGEILTRGPHVMQGYYRKPEATAAAIADGWFRTGDIGRLDPDGCLVITDRKKDLIKTAGGKFVAPQKLESRLAADPSISQAFVYGDRRPYCVALIVPEAAQLRRHALEQQIPGGSMHDLVRDPRIQAFYWERVQALQQDLPSYEQLKKIALLDQEFSQSAGELTPTLKARRAVIAQRHEGLLNRLYEGTGE